MTKRVSSHLLTAMTQTTKHLTSVGAHPDTPVYGLPEHDKAVFKGLIEDRIPCKSHHILQTFLLTI